MTDRRSPFIHPVDRLRDYLRAVRLVLGQTRDHLGATRVELDAHLTQLQTLAASQLAELEKLAAGVEALTSSPEAQHAQLVERWEGDSVGPSPEPESPDGRGTLDTREGHVFGRELPELETGEPLPAGDLERYFDANTEGPGIWKWQHYFPIYERHLGRFRGQAVHLVEIGVFSGGSLHMWREYLGTQSRITGVDIEPACKAYEADRISVAIGNQGDPAFWREFLAESAPIDVVIDDGSHLPDDQIVTLEALLPRLRPGGIYLCEDLHSVDNRFCRFVDGFTRNLDSAMTLRRRPDGGVAFETTPFQRSFASVHRYPFVTVIERARASATRFEAPRHGTEWQPFYEAPNA